MKAKERKEGRKRKKKGKGKKRIIQKRNKKR